MITEGTMRSLMDKEAKDIYGRTALHNAARDGKVEVVKQLLDFGANKNAMGKRGETPLTLAKDKRNDEVVELLQNSGTSGGGDKKGGFSKRHRDMSKHRRTVKERKPRYSNLWSYAF